jgi:hypothetical protein
MRKTSSNELNLAKTLQQIAFARGMNTKQWRTLEALSQFRFPLSASEWSDPDMIALLKNGLVCCECEDGAVSTWAATEVGSNLVQVRAENCYFGDSTA